MKSKIPIAKPLRTLLSAALFVITCGLLFGQELAVPSQNATTQIRPVYISQITLPIAGSEETLRVFTGKSMVVNSPQILKRVSVTSGEIATALIISPKQVLIHGLNPGSVTLLLWNEEEQMQAFNLRVEIDLEPLRETLHQAFPEETIRVDQSGNSVVLMGIVASEQVAERAAAVAQTLVPNVVSLLSETEMTDVVLLQVKFAEVDRSTLREWGVNIISTGTLNTPGTISTGQIRPPGGGIGVSNTIGAPLEGFGSTFQLTDLLNIFVFRPDLNLGLTIRALQQKNLLQILAEPNLLALGGKEASFLAGGEFPVPIVQGGTGIQTVTVQFKEFGIRLKFTALPTPDGIINLKVAPEVSALDFANAVTLSGFVIPALSTRRAETEVQLHDGQSFAIAGLLDNRTIEVASKIPVLGDVPLLGRLFRSRSLDHSNTELLVMVTPKLVEPLAPGQVPPLPGFPLPFLDPANFDGKTGEVPPAKPPAN